MAPDLRGPERSQGRAVGRAGGRGPAAGRPSRLKLLVRRHRAGLRRAGAGLGLAVLAAGAALAVRAADPMGRLTALAGRAAGLGLGSTLAVREVVVEGRRNAPLDQVLAAVGAPRGAPMLAFAPAEARARLEAMPWIAAARVERRLPGRVAVHLEERTPFALWQVQQRFSVVDREGRVLTSERIDGYGPLPWVVGAGAARAAAPLVELVRARPELHARVQAMTRVGDRRWTLRLHNGAEVLLPEGHEAAALARLSELHAAHGLLDRPVQTVDLRLPDKLVVRPIPGAPPGAPPGAVPGGAPLAAPAGAPASASPVTPVADPAARPRPGASGRG